MHYTIYKITNKINNKIYIGKHQTTDLNDGYMGSGKRLKISIRKYGIENFEKEILFCFDNESDMNDKESELVTEEFVKEDSNYNLCVGGHGGFSYINNTGLNTSGVINRDYKEIAKKVQETKSTRTYSVSDESRKKRSESNKLTNESRGKKTSAALRGKTKSDDHKRKISESVKLVFNRERIVTSPSHQSYAPIYYGLGNLPFKEKKRVRVPLGVPKFGC